MSCNTIVILIFIVFFVSCSKGFHKEDLYIDKFVYQKSDSTLFTGKLEVIDEASTYNKSFCDGIPCGEWSEREKNGGPFVAKGKYLIAEEIFSRSALQSLSSSTVMINYWQEGGDVSTDTRYLTILILKDDSFSREEQNQLETNIQQLANLFTNETRNLEFDYMRLSYVNAVHDWSKEYTKEYKRNN